MMAEPHSASDPTRIARAARDWWQVMRQRPSDVDQQQFTQWRDADPAHADAYERQLHLWDNGELLRQTKFGRGRRLPRASIFDRRPALAWASTGTVAALFLAGISLGIQPSGRWRQSPEQAVASFASPPTQWRTLRFADGSLVTLGAASRLRVAFAPTNRRLWLVAGRARFIAAHDAQRPFVVSADGADVIARGTVFDVALTAAGPRVVLLHGSIEVTRTAAMRPLRVLTAGQEILVARDRPLGTPQPAGQRERGWPPYMIALDATPLADAVAEINTSNPIKIALADPGLGTLRISGAFQSNDPRAFAAAAAVAFGLEVRHADGSLTLAAKSGARPAQK